MQILHWQPTSKCCELWMFLWQTDSFSAGCYVFHIGRRIFSNCHTAYTTHSIAEFTVDSDPNNLARGNAVIHNNTALYTYGREGAFIYLATLIRLWIRQKQIKYSAYSASRFIISWVGEIETSFNFIAAAYITTQPVYLCVSENSCSCEKTLEHSRPAV